MLTGAVWGGHCVSVERVPAVDGRLGHSHARRLLSGVAHLLYLVLRGTTRVRVCVGGGMQQSAAVRSAAVLRQGNGTPAKQRCSSMGSSAPARDDPAGEEKPQLPPPVAPSRDRCLLPPRLLAPTSPYGRPILLRDATTALAVPLVSTLVRWWLSATCGAAHGTGGAGWRRGRRVDAAERPG